MVELLVKYYGQSEELSIKKHLAIASHAANDSRCSLKNYSTLFLKFKYNLGGAWGIQTPDLINANDAFYQLN